MNKKNRMETIQLFLHLRKPRVLSPLRSLRVSNDVDLVPLACEDGFSLTWRKITAMLVNNLNNGT